MPAAGSVIYPSDVARVLARGRRISTTSELTSETGFIRLDGIPVKAGRMYEITASNMNIDTSVDNSIGAVRCRVETGGSTATTSSTQIGQVRYTDDSAATSNVLPLQVYYVPSSDTTLSVLLTVGLVTGTGTVKVYASSVEIFDLVVRDLGADPGDTAVLL